MEKLSSIPFFWSRGKSTLFDFSSDELIINGGRKFLIEFEQANQDIWIPGRLTFGGFFPIDLESVNENEFIELFRKFREQLKPVRCVKWKLPPDYFYPHIFDSQYRALKTLHSTYTVDLNQHINVTSWDLKLISKGNQKKLRQTMNLDLSYKLASPNDVEKCYKILTENRAMLGVSVSMTLDEILLALMRFPEIYRMNYMQLENEVVAMCFTVDIAPHVRYVLYWADNLKFRNLSPTVLLCAKLIESAKKDKIKILDLGISSVDGRLNQGLHRFKRNLGAIDSIKPTFNLLFQG